MAKHFILRRQTFGRAGSVAHSSGLGGVVVTYLGLTSIARLRRGGNIQIVDPSSGIVHRCTRHRGAMLWS